MRSLADDLRGRGDDQLAELLRARPDLAHPVPGDIATLAQRAASPASVSTALRGLDELRLHVLLLCCLAVDPVPVGEVGRALAAATVEELAPREARARARSALEQLHATALLWGPARSPHVVGAARDLLVPAVRGPLVAGVDATVARYVRDPAALAAVLAGMPDGARAALDRLLARPVIGTVVDARRDPDPDRSPVDWLLSRHLVVPFGADRVVVPGEVVLLCDAASARRRAAEGLRVPSLVSPRPRRGVGDAARAEAGAVAAVVDALHTVEELGDGLAAQPPARLRGGGLAARDVTRISRGLGVPESTVRLLVEVAAGAGLFAADNRDLSTVLPTSVFDGWRSQEPAQRHAQLLVAWRDLPRAIAGDGQRPLADELTAPHLPGLRADVLTVLAGDDGDWTTPELLAALRWRAPRLDWAAREPDVRAILDQLRVLGVLVGGWLTPAGRALPVEPPRGGAPTRGTPPGGADSAAPTRDVERVASALAATIPGHVEQLVLQGDLTAVVPGLPSPALADLLRLVARPESRGVASVYRISPESIRGALDEGWTPSALLTELGRWGAVPQPLSYLVTDTARTHAALRIGAASTYVRCDDPAQVAALVADPRNAPLGLFVVADTVLASDRPAEQVLEHLRTLGLHPVPDPDRGPARPPIRRARAREASEPASTPMTGALATAVVRMLRAGDRRGPAGPPRRADRSPREPAAARSGAPTGSGAGAPGDGSAGTSPAGPGEVVATLRRALADERPVLLGYASPTGVGEVRVQPLRVGEGYLTALDLDDQTIGTYSLARIGHVIPQG